MKNNDSVNSLPVYLPSDLAVLFLYAFVFLLSTYPLILHFSSIMPGNGGDSYLMAWFFWEFYRSVFILHKWPFFTNLVYYPHGVPLYVTTSMPLNSIFASAIYYSTKNLILAYNIIFFIAFMLNAYFAYLLAEDTVRNKTASFFAGLIFALSPMLIEQARWGDINIWSAYGIPLYIMFFNRLYKNPNLKNALFAAGGLFLATYAGFYEFTAMLLLYSVFFLIYNFLKNPVLNKKYIKYLIIMASVFIIASSPILIPSFYYVYIKKGILNFNPSLFWAKAYSATLVNFFIPPFFDRLLLPLTKHIYFNGIWNIMYRGANSLDFLGYIPLFFFIYALFRIGQKSGKPDMKTGGVNGLQENAKEIKFYAFAFLFFALMALSPLMHIINNIRVFDPFVYILDRLPVIKDVQESGRYMIIGFLFFGIVCAHGIKLFMERVSGRLKSGQIIKPAAKQAAIFIIISVIFIGTLAGCLPVPFIMIHKKLSRGVYILKREPFGAVLTVPFMQGGFKMYEQTVYQKPMLGGYVIRYGFHDLYKKYLPERFYDLKGVHYNGNGINQIVINRLGNPSNLAENFKYFKNLNLKYIVFLKGQLNWIYKEHNKPLVNKIYKFLKANPKKAQIIYNSRSMLFIKLTYKK